MALKKKKIHKKKGTGRSKKNPVILLNKLAGPLNDYRVNYLIWGGQREGEQGKEERGGEYSQDYDTFQQKENSGHQIQGKYEKTRPLSSESKTLSDILHQRLSAPFQVPESDNSRPVSKILHEKSSETGRQSFASITVRK